MSQTVSREIRTAAPSITRRITELGSIPFYAVILLCFVPLLCLHFRQLWLYEHYQYFPFLLLGFPFLIAQNREAEPIPRSGNGPWQSGLLFAGLGILALAVIGWSPNLSALALVLCGGAVLLHFYQTGHLSRFVPLWFVLFFLIKIPLNLDVDLIFWLQGITSKMASRSLDFLGVNHYLAGHNIRIASLDFAVEEACSGIQSLFSLLAMTALILAYYRRTLVHSVLLLLLAVFWACMINVVRVVTLVTAYERFNIDLTADRPHEMLGLVLFALAIGLMFSSDRLLLFFTADDTMEGDIDEIEHFESLGVTNAQPAASDCLPSGTEHKPANIAGSSTVAVSELPANVRVAVVASFLFLAVAQLAILALTSRGLQSINPDDPRLAGLFTEETLPNTMGRWKQTGFEIDSRSLTNYQGRNTARWNYESDEGQMVIAVDYPFLGWHELTGCYVAEGCHVDSREIVEADNTVRATITMPTGTRSQLIFSEFTNQGKPLLPLGKDAGTFAYWRSRLQSALIRQFASFNSNVGSFQVQLLHYSHDGASDEIVTELAGLQRRAADTIVAAVKQATAE